MSTRPPVSGGRVLLERGEETPGAVLYDVILCAEETRWSGRASVDLRGGAVELNEWRADAPPAWLEETARSFLQMLWRRWQADPSERWPRRLHRWRAPRNGPGFESRRSS